MTDDKKPVRCVAVVQCHISHERCPGVACATAFANREHHFADYGDKVDYYIPFTCGGCPGRRVSRLVSNVIKRIKKQGVERDEIVVHLSACMINDSGHYPACPHLEYIKRIVARKKVRVVEGTYVSQTAEKRRQAGGYD
jgi:predicted metal-binding protein